ncbi:hypothetical protein AB1L88_16885 [Tautonia sp. JC769]|uniref:hypothetical protein n=1 Tax=Tautonia sp. JC769 TaxID=3232135 RepID=UPI003457859F
MNEQPPQHPMRSVQDTAGMLLAIPKVLAFTAEVFLHTRMGERYAGVQAVLGLPLIFIYTLIWEGHDPRPMLVFLALYVLMCLRNRVEILLRSGSAPRAHSRYTGRPRWLKYAPKVPEVKFKQDYEPSLLLLFGAATATFYPPLGIYMMLAGVGLFVSVSSSLHIERQQLLDLNDLVIEQQERAERFRAMRGDDS